MKKIFVDVNGVYLGTFDCTALAVDQKAAWLAAEVPSGAIDVPHAPKHAAAIWNGQFWDEAPPPKPLQTPAEKLSALKTVLIARGLIAEEDLAAATTIGDEA